MTVINAFPGYEFRYSEKTKKKHNMYRGVDLSRGGYVYAQPGIHRNVALLDVSGMHPASAINLNYLGEYTENFKELIDARTHIKHGEFDIARNMFGGRLKPYLEDEGSAKELSNALKIANNSVYGLTSAKFNNAFRDPRNENNIVALRGALFMKTLQDEVTNRGFEVAHIKTDSIKIPDANQKIIDFCIDFGKKYGYDFEHEATYERMCLVNNAVYVAKDADSGKWTATGTQFAVPYVFKTLFSKEPIVFDDLCEAKQVSSEMYLDFNESLPDVSGLEKELAAIIKKDPDTPVEDIRRLEEEIAKGHDYHFVGKVGLFCPVLPGRGGGHLVRKDKDKYYAVVGTKGYLWMEAEMVKNASIEDGIDLSYYRRLVDEAGDAISRYGELEEFLE